MRVLDVCAGSGMLGRAAAAAVGAAGPARYCAVENDPAARRVLEAHGHLLAGDDLAGFGADRGAYGLICGGTPCQSFSAAADRAHRTGRFGASGLLDEFLRVVDEGRPPLVVWENVLGARTPAPGYPRGPLAHVLGVLDGLGYDAAAERVDGRGLGLCHRRFRLVVAAVLRGREVPAAPAPDAPPAAPAPGAPPAVPTPKAADGARARSIPESPRAGSGAYSSPKGRRHIRDQICALGSAAAWREYMRGPLERHARAVGRPMPDVVDAGNRLTPQFYEWLMGWPDGWTEAAGGDAARIRMCGNGVVPLQMTAGVRAALRELGARRRSAVLPGTC